MTSPKDQPAETNTTVMSRLIGIVTFKPAVYRAVAEDKRATTTAVAIGFGVLVIVSISILLFHTLTYGFSYFGSIFAIAVSSFVLGLIYWFLNTWLLTLISRSFFKGTADAGMMLRATGFASIFKVIGVIPSVGGLIALLLGIVAMTFCVREAARLETGKAILIASIVTVIYYIVSFAVAVGLGLIGIYGPII